MIRVIEAKNDEILTALYVFFIVGCDELKLKGAQAIRVRAGIMRAFKAVSFEGENGKRISINENGVNLRLTQEQYEIMEKCFDVVETRSLHAITVEEALDAFSSAGKE